MQTPALALEQLEAGIVQGFHIYIIIKKALAGHAHHHLRYVRLEEYKEKMRGAIRLNMSGTRIATANRRHHTCINDTIDNQWATPMEHPFHTAHGHDIHGHAPSFCLHHPVMMHERSEIFRRPYDRSTHISVLMV